jgi:hypothetical protein
MVSLVYMTTGTPLVTLRPQKVALTMRKDAWWVTPLVTFVVLSTFIVYATWAALQNAHYSFGNYLSPFYSPEIFGDSPHALFGPKPGWYPDFLPFSPAILILWAPAGFRLTCYYYRGAYYKAFWADPPSCAVGEPRKHYLGEQTLPLILQNVHRYFLYLALLFLIFLTYDAVMATQFQDPATGETSFGIGLGTLVITANVVFLALYTLSCHSFRHLIGGKHDTLSNKPLSLACYGCVSAINRRHMNFAWISLFGVMGADLYVRLCSMGVISDLRIV